MIKLRNVSFAYGEKQVLKDISFEVADLESLVIMGPSGSGKSTILRLILGLECPQKGDVIVDSKNLCIMREREKRGIRKKIGMVFQDGALFDSMTVGENVGYYLIEHSRLHDDEIERQARQMLGFVGLDADEVIDLLPEQLSGGMRRRVAIGRALLSTDPKIMLFDEPTTGLDPKATRKVLNLIAKLRQEKEISIIAVTHQIVDALALAERFVVLDDGEVVFDGDMVSLRQSSDSRVRSFLDPFKNSFEAVLQMNFIGD